MLNSGRLQKQVPFFEEMNKLGYIITQLDLQHSAGWVGGSVRTENTMKKLFQRASLMSN